MVKRGLHPGGSKVITSLQGSAYSGSRSTVKMGLPPRVSASRGKDQICTNEALPVVVLKLWSLMLFNPERTPLIWQSFAIEISCEQVCIPVGCIPPACWLYRGSASRGICIQEGVHLGGIWFQVGGGLHPGSRGVCNQWEGGLHPGSWADPLPLWTEWQTDVKTLPCPKLRLWAVIMCFPGTFEEYCPCFVKRVLITKSGIENRQNLP